MNQIVVSDNDDWVATYQACYRWITTTYPQLRRAISGCEEDEWDWDVSFNVSTMIFTFNVKDTSIATLFKLTFG